MEKVIRKNAYLVIDEFGPLMSEVVIAANEAEARRIYFAHRQHFNSEFRDSEEMRTSQEDFDFVNIDVVEVVEQ